MKTDNFTLTIEDGIATLIFDIPDSKVNILNHKSMAELNAHLDALKKNTEIKVLRFVSAKKDIFIAGADITEIRSLDDCDTAYDVVRHGQIILEKIAYLPFPTIAVIDGACLGGGFELALRCTYRIATENKATKIGLPEVNLGVIPGFGGTQTLQKLIGPSKALELILGAKYINGAKALKLGMVDACVPQGYLDFKLAAFTQSILNPIEQDGILKKRYQPTLVERLTPWIITMVAHKTVMEKTKGHYPAPLAVIEIFKKTNGMDSTRALEFEARTFAQMAVTPESKNLISVYFALEAVKNEKALVSKEALLPVKFTSVIGGGAMGGGIVWLFAKMDLLVRLYARSFDKAAQTLQHVAQSFDFLKKRRRLNAREVDMKLSLISYGTDLNSFGHSDLAIEAIVEDMTTKKQTFKELEAVMRDDAIIATNTSSLSINLLSSDMQHPERFIGMHFFNPVEQMPLVEIIPSKVTKPEVIATIVSLAKKAGKTPIVVNDCPGFLVNRILLPYINECAKMLHQGEGVERIDTLIETFGMPMGPFVLADTVGLDVGYKVASVLHQGYGERMEVSTLLDRAYNELHLLGKKAKRGFYIHEGKNKTLNPDIQTLQSSKVRLSDEEIIDRAMLIMVNEAAYCLQEGIVKNAQHLDVAMIMGTGFPPFRGGLLKYADTYGLEKILHALLRLRDKYGMRFEPAPLLQELAHKGLTFYKGIK